MKNETFIKIFLKIYDRAVFEAGLCSSWVIPQKMIFISILYYFFIKNMFANLSANHFFFQLENNAAGAKQSK